MNSPLRQQAVDLRLKELSYGEIRKRLRVSKSTLSYWLRDFPLSRWMEQFLGLNRDKIKVQLHLYENMNIETEKRFWQDILGLKPEQFYPPSLRKLQNSSFTYQESFRHGTCSIYALGVEKHREVMMAIKAFLARSESMPMGK